MAYCMKCRRALTADEVGLHKKMINRGATEHLCMTCLAEFFHCEESLLEHMIQGFREQGCLLFSQDTERPCKE